MSNPLRGLITLWIVVSAVFFALRATGDPTTMLLPDDTPTDIVEMYRQKWGFDQPIPVQYFTFLGDVLRGHLGGLLRGRTQRNQSCFRAFTQHTAIGRNLPS
ncbi:hypothetical protein ACOJBO_10605 [Rhizobium beringeri]